MRKSPPRSIKYDGWRGSVSPVDTRERTGRARRACSVPVAGRRYVTGIVLFIKVMAHLAYWLTAALERPLNRASDRPDLATKHAILRSQLWSSLRWLCRG